MKNNECTICIATRHGYVQRYCKEKDGWTQTSPEGKVGFLVQSNCYHISCHLLLELDLLALG